MLAEKISPEIPVEEVAAIEVRGFPLDQHQSSGEGLCDGITIDPLDIANREIKSLGRVHLQSSKVLRRRIRHKGRSVEDEADVHVPQECKRSKLKFLFAAIRKSGSQLA